LEQWPISTLHLYSADVSPRFLDKLERPGDKPEPDAGMVVRHRALPSQPYERLGGMVSGLADEVAAVDDAVKQSIRAQRRKRKRSDGGERAAGREDARKSEI
jgi:hypothetical protein